MPSDGSVPLLTLLAANPFPTGLLIAIIALVIMSGFFSSTETAYSCANRIKLRSLVSNGNKKAEKVLDLAEEKYDKLISSILIGSSSTGLNASVLIIITATSAKKTARSVYKSISKIIITPNYSASLLSKTSTLSDFLSVKRPFL